MDKITYEQYQHQDFSKHKDYLDLQVDHDLVADKDDNKSKSLLTDKEFDVLKQELTQQFKPIDCGVDPTIIPLDKQRPLIMYCNDPRKNIFSPKTTEEDKKYENVESVNIFVKGVHYFGVISTKNIKKRKKLCYIMVQTIII